MSLVAGANGAGLPARALLHFDVAGHVPANAIIKSATLTMNVVMAPGGGGNDSVFDLHRLLVGWTEGMGSGNTGSPANDREPTWNDRAYPSVPWAVPGGGVSNDFSAAISGSSLVSGVGSYTFASTTNLVTDVQQWLLNPATNFGWILISESESTAFTARRFGAREDPANTSTLEIQYAQPVVTEIQWIKAVGDQIQFNFLASPGQPYTIQFRDSLAFGNWQTLSTIAPQDTATNLIVTDPFPPSGQRFYRIGAF